MTANFLTRLVGRTLDMATTVRPQRALHEAVPALMQQLAPEFEQTSPIEPNSTPAQHASVRSPDSEDLALQRIPTFEQTSPIRPNSTSAPVLPHTDARDSAARPIRFHSVDRTTVQGSPIPEVLGLREQSTMLPLQHAELPLVRRLIASTPPVSALDQAIRTTSADAPEQSVNPEQPHIPVHLVRPVSPRFAPHQQPASQPITARQPVPDPQEAQHQQLALAQAPLAEPQPLADHGEKRLSVSAIVRPSEQQPNSTTEPAAVQPSIRVRIGRVEVRANTPAPSTQRARPERLRPTISLDDYLKQRGGRHE
ncbi:MAG: hypothetical protein SH847_19230 [Roseiflexaceae bacterium]|nr:hypothetical protein [Roseiflexaceae bacterium]